MTSWKSPVWAKASIYHAYGSKRDLYLRVFATYCGELVVGARRSLDDETNGSPRERLEGFFFGLAEAFGSESPRRGCFLSRAIADLASTDADVARLASEAFAQLAAAFAGTVRAAQVSGEVTSTLDADSLGFMLLSVMRGIDSLARAGVPSSILIDVARTATSLL
jgi:TetR/AcrR family transcriptional regulator, transcriptional repressor for nem operon